MAEYRGYSIGWVAWVPISALILSTYVTLVHLTFLGLGFSFVKWDNKTVAELEDGFIALGMAPGP